MNKILEAYSRAPKQIEEAVKSSSITFNKGDEWEDVVMNMQDAMALHAKEILTAKHDPFIRDMIKKVKAAGFNPTKGFKEIAARMEDNKNDCVDELKDFVYGM